MCTKQKLRIHDETLKYLTKYLFSYNEEVFFKFYSMNKKNLGAFVAAGALAVTGANATPPKDGKCSDNQTATVSAIHGVIDCQDQRTTGLPETFSPRSESRAPLVETTL